MIKQPSTTGTLPQAGFRSKSSAYMLVHVMGLRSGILMTDFCLSDFYMHLSISTISVKELNEKCLRKVTLILLISGL